MSVQEFTPDEIRRRRQERGWTQAELARRVGVQPQAVQAWESGATRRSVAKNRDALRRAFDDDPDDGDVGRLRRELAAATREAEAWRAAFDAVSGLDGRVESLERDRDRLAKAVQHLLRDAAADYPPEEWPDVAAGSR